MKRYLQNRKEASSYNPFHDIWIVRMYVKYIRSVISRIGEKNSDDELMKTYKHESVLLVLLLCIAAGINAIIYWLFGLPVFILNVSMLYVLVNIVAIGIFHVTKNYSFFYTTYGILTILFVGFMSIVLGGLQESGFIIVLGIIIPMSITVSSNIITGGIWAVIYMIMIIIVALHSIVGIFRIPWEINLLLGWKSTFLLYINMSMALLMFYIMISHLHLTHLFFRDRSEMLLYSALPRSLIQRMENSGYSKEEFDETFSEHHDDVAVLFADISGFTEMASDMIPRNLIQTLNTIFSEFDSLCEKYNIEKIKTIGDCYMAIAKPINKKDHPERMVRFASEILEYIKNIRITNVPVRLRVGIHCGEVITGVIGADKLTYDLWGNTVNIANRIEAHATANAITISQNMYERICHIFRCKNNRVQDLKGIGMIGMWDVNDEIESYDEQQYL